MAGDDGEIQRVHRGLLCNSEAGPEHTASKPSTATLTTDASDASLPALLGRCACAVE